MKMSNSKCIEWITNFALINHIRIDLWYVCGEMFVYIWNIAPFLTAPSSDQDKQSFAHHWTTEIIAIWRSFFYR